MGTLADAREVDAELATFLDGVMGVVEATSCEVFYLWRECTENGETWVQDYRGLGELVGKLDEMPVFLCLTTSTVRGCKILFIHPTSAVVDHRLIDAWVERVMPASARRANGSVNRTDAMNFCNIFPRGGALRASHDARQVEAERCEYCDGTGDVHSIDGEWRGVCTCPAGDALRNATPSDASQADSKSGE